MVDFIKKLLPNNQNINVFNQTYQIPLNQTNNIPNIEKRHEIKQKREQIITEDLLKIENSKNDSIKEESQIDENLISIRNRNSELGILIDVVDQLQFCKKFHSNPIEAHIDLLSSLDYNPKVAKSGIFYDVYRELISEKQKNENLSHNYDLLKLKYDSQNIEFEIVKGNYYSLLQKLKNLEEENKEFTIEKLKSLKEINHLKSRMQEEKNMIKNDIERAHQIASKYLNNIKELKQQIFELNSKTDQLQNQLIAKPEMINQSQSFSTNYFEQMKDQKAEIIPPIIFNKNLDSLISDQAIGQVFYKFLSSQDLFKVLILSKQVHKDINTNSSFWIQVNSLLLNKIKNINNKKEEKEDKSLQIQDKSYVNNLSIPVINKYIIDGKKHDDSYESILISCRQFLAAQIFIHQANEMNKSFFGKITSFISQSSQSNYKMESLNDVEKMKEKEKEWTPQILCSIMSKYAETIVSNNQLLHDWFSKLQKCFCECYLSLVKLSNEIKDLETVKEFLLSQNTNFTEIIKKLNSHKEDIDAKYEAVNEVNKYLSQRIKGMEERNNELTIELIQMKREFMKSNEQIDQLKGELISSDSNFKAIKIKLAKIVKAQHRKLEKYGKYIIQWKNLKQNVERNIEEAKKSLYE